MPAQGTGLLISTLRQQLAQATANLAVAEKRAGDAEQRAACSRTVRLAPGGRIRRLAHVPEDSGRMPIQRQRTFRLSVRSVAIRESLRRNWCER